MKFSVENMTCGHCVKAITNAVKDADQQAQVEIDLGQKIVNIESQLSAEQVEKLLAEEGYTATLTQ